MKLKDEVLKRHERTHTEMKTILLLRAWVVLEISSTAYWCKIQLFGVYSSTVLVIMPNFLLGLLHSCTFSGGLLWFLGRRCSGLAWVILAGHAAQSRVSNLWAGCHGGDGQGNLSTMPGPKAPDMVCFDGRSFTNLPCTAKSAILYQRGETTREMHSILTLSCCTSRFLPCS